MINGDADGRYCSFCGRDGTPDRRLVAGPGIAICQDCVSTARELLTAPTGSAATSLGPAWEQLSNEEILQHLPEISRVSLQLEEQLKRWVGAARERNISWSRIGAALGITRQTAWERFKTVI